MRRSFTELSQVIKMHVVSQCSHTIDREIFAVRNLFRRKLNTRNILCNVHRSMPILVAKDWQRNLDYAKNLQAKYFTGKNIPIYDSFSVCTCSHNACTCTCTCMYTCICVCSCACTCNCMILPFRRPEWCFAHQEKAWSSWKWWPETQTTKTSRLSVRWRAVSHRNER